MGIGKGSAKTLAFKRQTAKGTMATPTGAQLLRRNTSTMNLAKETQTTETEQTSRRQITSARHGPRQVNGSINGILSPGTYSDFLSALLMRDFASVPDITSVSVTIAGTGPSWTITRGTGDWLAGGAKIGRVCRLSVGTLNAANINKNLMIIGVTTNALTVVPVNRRLALVAEGPVAGCTVSFPGKLTYVPESGHSNVYYTVEEWRPDVPRSEVSQDIKVGQATIRIPGTGNCTIDFSLLGLDQSKGSVEYFTAPTAESTTEAVTAAVGALYAGGVRQAVVTDATLTIDGRAAVADAVVGDDIRPDVFTGKLVVSGSLTAYFDSGALADAFIDEVDQSLVFALAAGALPGSDFITFVMSKAKLNSADADDAETGAKRTYNFSAVFNTSGGPLLATNGTTIEMQDSAAV